MVVQPTGSGKSFVSGMAICPINKLFQGLSIEEDEIERSFVYEDLRSTENSSSCNDDEQ